MHTRTWMSFWAVVLVGIATAPTFGCGETTPGDTAADGGSSRVNASAADAAPAGDPVTVEKRYDSVSDTYYYLTRIRHTDEAGQLLPLRLAEAKDESGETVPDFAARMGNPRAAWNASMGQGGQPDGVVKPAGIQIVNGVIVQEDVPATKIFTLGIKADNELVSYPFGTTAQQMLEDGAVNALTAFVPLIEDHERVSDEVLQTVANLDKQHPRQVIVQFDNLDLMVFSCGGRGFEGQGMTALDIIRVLQEHERDVKFAFNLDGGGSVTTVVNGERITPQIDGDGTLDRPRPNFLYVP